MIETSDLKPFRDMDYEVYKDCCPQNNKYGDYWNNPHVAIIHVTDNKKTDKAIVITDEVMLVKYKDIFYTLSNQTQALHMLSLKMSHQNLISFLNSIPTERTLYNRHRKSLS